MSIFTNSRYTKTPLVLVEGKTPTFSLREIESFNYRNAMAHVFKEGDNLDNLAVKYYNSSHLWWIFLDANPQYLNPLDVKVGDILLIPSITEVIGKI